jgi:hypothetical protein
MYYSASKVNKTIDWPAIFNPVFSCKLLLNFYNIKRKLYCMIILILIFKDSLSPNSTRDPGNSYKKISWVGVAFKHTYHIIICMYIYVCMYIQHIMCVYDVYVCILLLCMHLIVCTYDTYFILYCIYKLYTQVCNTSTYVICTHTYRL